MGKMMKSLLLLLGLISLIYAASLSDDYARRENIVDAASSKTTDGSMLTAQIEQTTLESLKELNSLPAACWSSDENAAATEECQLQAKVNTASMKVDNSYVALEGTTSFNSTSTGEVQFKSNLSISRTTESRCANIEDAASLTQTQLINLLTAPCRYDRLERPQVMVNGSLTDEPVQVYARAYVYVMQNLDTSNLQFKLHALLQVRYVDPRLAFGQYATNRHQPIMGESDLRQLIWVPHIFIANEHESNVMGTSEKDILTSIAGDGSVIISSRIQATLYCWMNLKKFPFDEQTCSTNLESWMYNTSELLLHWERSAPLTFDPKMHLTEYSLLSSWSNESIINANLSDMRHGAFAGNYSSLSFTVRLTREVGYYVMDYFLPSMMIVAISWVSFWLQADQTPARTTLGTTTMLSFITLASSQENNLPKVSYIKVSEVWFLGCTVFIFGSLVEFAFVNTIWRRSRNLELKKLKGKYILKQTLTPSMRRRKMREQPKTAEQQQNNINAAGNNKNHCNSSSDQSAPPKIIRNFLTVDSPTTPTSPPPVIITDLTDDENNNNRMFNCSLSIEDNESQQSPPVSEKDAPRPFSTMTPHEVSLYIDRKARFVFPLAFIIFNALFWTFVYCL